jgi:RimJ/RimL family protein N-acetyltransferase
MFGSHVDHFDSLATILVLGRKGRARQCRHAGEAGDDLQLETARLVLREFKRTDWKEVHQYACDPDVVTYMEWGPNTPEQTKQFISQSIENQREKPRRIYDFAVTLRDDGKLIGACGMRLLPMDNQQADFGYCYNKAFWRQGYGSEAARAILKLGFGSFGLHRMFATCDARNAGSAAVLRSCGLRQEAHFIKDKRIKGVWRDTLLFAILREEWEKTQ